jgi:hypothetical protein
MNAESCTRSLNSHIPAVTVFTGRFGSGKTEVAINYALAILEGSPLVTGGVRPPAGHEPGPGRQSPSGVSLIDLDIVTPYFRSRETAVVMAERGVSVITPSVVGQHLDTPAITPEILGAIQRPDRPVVLDVGGDRQGARALGQFSTAIRQRGSTGKVFVYFVVNPYRPFTGSVEDLVRSIAEIEESSRLQITGLVSNPNLIAETTVDRILEGHAQAETYARATGLPIAFACVERRWAARLGLDGGAKPRQSRLALPVLVLDRHFSMPWEEALEGAGGA